MCNKGPPHEVKLMGCAGGSIRVQITKANMNNPGFIEFQWEIQKMTQAKYKYTELPQPKTLIQNLSQIIQSCIYQ